MGCAQVIFLQTKIINETCDVGSTDNVLATFKVTTSEKNSSGKFK